MTKKPWPGILLALALGANAASADPCAVPANLAAARPHPEGTPTAVTVAVFFVDVKAIANAEQSFTADFYLLAEWRDPRLAAGALGASLAGCRLKLDEVWHPGLAVVNQRFLRKSYPEAVVVDEAGAVRYQQRLFGQLSSPLDLRDFPFDRQRLPIDLVAVGHSPQQVAFSVGERTGRRESFSVAGWSLELAEPRVEAEYVRAVDRRLAAVRFTLDAERHFEYYLWKMLVPLSLIIFMAWTVFWIEPKNVGPQIGISTATVFTLIAFQFSLGRLLPPVSYLTRADKFLLGATLLVFAALGEAILTGKLADTEREETARRVDRWARWIYAALFVVLIGFTLWSP